MNIIQMKEGILTFKEECIVGREFTIRNTAMYFLGFALIGTQMHAYFLSQNQERDKDSANMDKKRRKGTLTHREECLAYIGRDLVNHGMNSIRISKKKYEYESATSTSITGYAMQENFLLSHFIQAGLSFGGFEELEVDNLSMTSVTFKGEYKKIPFKESEIDTLEIQCSDSYYRVPVKKKLLLTIGEGKRHKYSFISEHNGKSYEFYIENTSFFDPWYDIEERCEDPEYKERFTKEQLEEMKQTMSQYLENKVERGQQYIIVTYESEEVTFDIYASEYLKEKAKINTGSTMLMGYMFKSDSLSGRHGLRKRTTCIQYPVDKDITNIAVEIIAAHIREKIEPISFAAGENSPDVFDER